MAFDTKFNLSDNKFEQAPSDILTLSGTTNFSTVDGGDLLIDGISIKTLTGSTSGGTVQVENGLYSGGGFVRLGGPLSEDTIIDLSGRTLFLGNDGGLQVLLDPSNNRVSITNDASVFAPTPLMTTYPTLSLGVYFDSGTTEMKVDAANVTDALSVVGFSCDAAALFGDDPNGLTYEGSIIGSIPSDGTFTFYGSALNNEITLLYIYNSLIPRSGGFFAIDNPTANAADQGTAFPITSSPADGFVGENIKQFIGSNYLGFPLEDEDITSRLNFYNDGSIGVESTNGQGIKFESSYDNSTLADNSYIPKSWAKERFDILSGQTALVSNGIKLSDTGYIVLGGSLTGNTEIVGENAYGMRFRNIDHFGVNIQNVSFSIDNNPGFDGFVVGLNPGFDGKIYVGGKFTSYSGITGSTVQNLVRLNPDRTLDTTFQIQGSGFTTTTPYFTYVTVTCQLSGGSVMVGGNFSAYNDNDCWLIAKLNSNGTEDTTWSANAGIGGTSSANSHITSIVEYAGNTVLVGGGVLVTWNGANLPGNGNNVFRLQENGLIDTSFTTGMYGGGSGPSVTKILALPDGRIFTTGFFETFSGVTCQGYVMRLPNGHIDSTFKLSGATGEFGGGYVYDAILLSSGDIAMIGYFTNIGGVPRNGVAVIDTDGNLNLSFNPSGFTDTLALSNMRAIIELSNGKFIVGYGGAAPTGYTSNGIIRFNPSGSIDGTFNPGGVGFAQYDDGFGNWQYPLRFAKSGPEEDIFMVGEFLTYNNNIAYAFTKINSGGTLIVNDNPAFIVANTTVEYSDQRHYYYTNRTLVDKEYVDLSIDNAILISGGTSNAVNGLNIYGNAVRLGGQLTGTTTIGGSAGIADLYLGDYVDPLLYFELHSAEGFYLDGSGGFVDIDAGANIRLSATATSPGQSDTDGTLVMTSQKKTTNTVAPVAQFNRTSTGTTQNGVGVRFDLGLRNDANNTRYMQFQHILSDVAAGSEDATFLLRGYRAGALTDFMKIEGGQTTLQSTFYGVGQYNADYSANFGPRSFVDKGYVTGLTSSNTKLSFTITGDSVTTAFGVTHNKNSRDVIVQVYDATSFDTVLVDVTRTTVNAVTVTFSVAPANGATYRVVII